MTIKDWSEAERPRERLLRQGVEALSPAELLAIFLRVGIRGKSAVDLAQDLLARFDGSLMRLSQAGADELSAIPGMGPAKSAQLMATLELARRALSEPLRCRDALGSPGTVKNWLRLRLGGLTREVFMVLLLDAQNRLIEARELFQGTLTQANVYPREVVKLALAHNAAAVIFAHNHPSGAPDPSHADEILTQALKQALALVDIRVLDHLVVTQSDCCSFAERGWL